MEKQNISKYQVTSIAATLLVGSISYLISAIIKTAGRTSWLAAVLGMLFIIPIVFLMLYLGKRYPGCTIFEIMEKTLGKVISRVFAFFYAVICMSVSIIILRLFTTLVKSFFLHFTPIYVIAGIVVAISLVIILSGLENLARLMELIYVVILINYFVGITPSVIQHFSIKNIMPIFVEKTGAFFGGIFLAWGTASEMALFIMVLIAYMQKPSENYKPLALGTAIMSWGFMLSLFFVVGILGSETASNVSFGGLTVAYGAKLGDFIQGVEGFILIAYHVAAISTTSAHMYGAWKAVGQIITKPKSKVLLGIIAGIILIVTNFITFNQAFLYATYIGRFVVLPFVVIVTLITWVSVLVRGKKVLLKQSAMVSSKS